MKNPLTITNARGSPTKEGIRTTQRSWLRYRDVWISFGAIHYPQVSADSWKAWLDKERIAEFSSIKKNAL